MNKKHKAAAGFASVGALTAVAAPLSIDAIKFSNIETQLKLVRLEINGKMRHLARDVDEVKDDIRDIKTKINILHPASAIYKTRRK